jgi:hypothetical protein
VNMHSHIIHASNFVIVFHAFSKHASSTYPPILLPIIDFPCNFYVFFFEVGAGHVIYTEYVPAVVADLGDVTGRGCNTTSPSPRSFVVSTLFFNFWVSDDQYRTGEQSARLMRFTSRSSSALNVCCLYWNSFLLNSNDKSERSPHWCPEQLMASVVLTDSLTVMYLESGVLHIRRYG